jgi:hypothetical protein
MRCNPRLRPLLYSVGIMIPLLACSRIVQADSAHSVDAVRGNALDPSGTDPTLAKDPRGIGAFHEGPDRTPSGLLYLSPFLPPDPIKSDIGWDYGGSLEAGVLAGDANNNAAFFRQYQDLRNGLLLHWFSFNAMSDSDAKYVSVFGSSVGYKDQFYGIQYGRWNDYKLKLFFEETPHVLRPTHGRSGRVPAATT